MQFSSERILGWDLPIIKWIMECIKERLINLKIYANVSTERKCFGNATESQWKIRSLAEKINQIPQGTEWIGQGCFYVDTRIASRKAFTLVRCMRENARASINHIYGRHGLKAGDFKSRVLHMSSAIPDKNRGRILWILVNGKLER